MVFLRADFPHDNYWQRVRFTFSDGGVETAALQKTDQEQCIALAAPRRVTWIRMDALIQDPDDPSPFPALTQWMVFGA